MSLTAEQLQARSRGIGGSDMAAILGLDPYKQGIEVFSEKRPDLVEPHGFIPQTVEGDAIDFGNFIEEPVARLYSKNTGRKVRNQHQTAAHKKYSFLRGNIDRFIVGEHRGLEIKSVNWRLAHPWGEAGTGDIAEYYLPQIHHYLLVMDWPVWHVAALIGGATDFRIYSVERDPEWDDIIIDAATDFWALVEKGEPPAIDYEHRTAPEVIKRVYTNIDGEVELPSEALAIHDALKQVSDQRKAYETTEKTLRAHLQNQMGNAGIARIPGLKGAYTRKCVHREGYEVQSTDYIQFSYNARVK